MCTFQKIVCIEEARVGICEYINIHKVFFFIVLFLGYLFIVLSIIRLGGAEAPLTNCLSLKYSPAEHRKTVEGVFGLQRTNRFHIPCKSSLSKSYRLGLGLGLFAWSSW